METLLEYWPHWVAAVDGASALACSAHIVLTKRDPRAASLWIGLVWLVPLLGLLLYLVLGINRMPRRAAMRALITRQSVVLAEFVAADSPAGAEQPIVVGNKITSLRGGDVAYAEMLSAIAAARDTILMSTYIFDNDRAGKLFCEAFREAVGRGVAVSVIIDAVGARYSIPSVVGPLKQAGVQVERFSRTRLPWRLRYANLRTHRKLMVIDGVIGFTGGMNIREDCLIDLSPASPTLDLHFRVEGPVVAELQRVLVEDWEFCTHQSLDSHRYFQPQCRVGDTSAMAIADGPDRPSDPILWSRLAALARAERSVRIATPYFVPDLAVITALGMAVSKGVRVEIFLPAKNNLRLIKWASTALLEQVLELGCRVFYVRGPFDHSKLMLVDEGWAQIGSANWDARSFRLNFEFDLVCHGESVTTPLHQLLDTKLDEADRLTLEQVRARSRLVRLRDGCAALAAPYL